MKNPIKNMLYIFNDNEINEDVLRTVTDYAKAQGAHLNFLRIYESYKSMSKFFNMPSFKLVKKLQTKLEESVDKHKKIMAGVKFSCHVREGIWFIEAIQESIRTKSDLIVISEAMSNRHIFASDAMHLIRKSAIPVWYIRNNIFHGYKKIGVAIDIDLNDKIKKDVNQRCMQFAEQLKKASKNKCEILVLHCWSLANEKYLREIASNVSSAQLQEMTSREKQYHQEWFKSFCDKHGDVIDNLCFLKGDPEVIIPEFINSHQIDILTMGTVNNIVTPGLYISSRSEAILNAVSNCAVLTVKPKGFVSPV